jgi:hypothetical protein
MNQSLYFDHVFLGGHHSRTLLDAVLNRCQVMDGSIGFRVLQEAQVLLGLLILQEVYSADEMEKVFNALKLIIHVNCNRIAAVEVVNVTNF